jgi:hypothetical protein
MPELIRYRNKTMQSGIFLLRYRTEMKDAGMPMPALVLWMPMPSYGNILEHGLHSFLPITLCQLFGNIMEHGLHSFLPITLCQLLGNILEHGLHSFSGTTAGLVDTGHQVVTLLTVYGEPILKNCK